MLLLLIEYGSGTTHEPWADTNLAIGVHQVMKGRDDGTR